MLNRMQVFHYKLISNTMVITDLGRDSKSCKGGGGGVKIFQPPLQYFTPLVTNIGELLSRTTPANMWSGEFVSTWTDSPAQGSKFTSANPPVHDLCSLRVLEELLYAYCMVKLWFGCFEYCQNIPR